MRNLSVFFLLFFLYGCEFAENNASEESHKCASYFYGDSLLVSKNKDSLVTISNYLTKEVYRFVSKTEYCILPIIRNNHLYFLKSDSSVECVSLSSKSKVWEFKTTNKINNIKSFGQFLVLNIEHQGVKVLKLQSGQLLRDFNRAKGQKCNDMLINDFILDHESLFITDFNCNNISSVDLNSGDLKWGYNTNLSATRFLLCDTLLFGGITGNPLEKEGKIVLFNKKSGKVVFERKELFDLVVKPVKYLSSVLFVTYDQKIKKFNLSTRQIEKLVELKDLGGICDNQLYLQGNKLYFSNCDNEIYEYDLLKDKLVFIKKTENKLVNVFEFDKVLHFEN